MEMIQVNLAWPELWTLEPTVSVALTVTENVPVLVGLPVILPVLPLIDRPGGRPVAVQLVMRALAVDTAVSSLDTVVP